jgi:hypothetical protein
MWHHGTARRYFRSALSLALLSCIAAGCHHRHHDWRGDDSGYHRHDDDDGGGRHDDGDRRHDHDHDDDRD